MNTLHGVYLDLDEADYISRALALLQQMLADNRATPTPRLQSVAAKLAKCAANGSPSAGSGSKKLPSSASAGEPVQHPEYALAPLISTSEAARILDTGERNVRDLVARGRLIGRRAGGRGRWLLEISTVERFAAAKAARRAAG